ncbi:MAG: hypothetical protein JWO71_706 [Candidatus Acidoferrum typicum]|nr:hypothetical protein [Candidatus Acidoferrum typicum]
MAKKTLPGEQNSPSTWIKGISDSRLSEMLAKRARLNAPASTSGTEIARQPGFVFLRPPCKGIDCPENGGDGPPHDPCRGLPFVWPPVVAVKILAPDFTCPEQSVLDQIKQAVARNLAPFKFTNPDVRVSCGGEPPFITVLIWPSQVAPNSCNDLARRRAELPGYMNQNGGFGIYIGAGLIRNLAQAALDATRTLDGDGAPSNDGPIHLTGLSVDFIEHDVTKTTLNNIIKTYITGYDERPWPDVGFTVTLTDVLCNIPTLHAVSTSNVDKSGLDEFLAVALFPVAFVSSIFPPLTFLLLNDLEAYQVQPHDSNTGGVGARLLATIPDEIPLPHTGGLPNSIALARLGPGGAGGLPTVMSESRKKLVINYGQPIVNDSGLYVSGAVQIPFPDRVPAVHIIGPTSLAMDLNATQTFGYFSVEPTDFYGKLSFVWTGGPVVNIPSPNAKRTAIFFHRGTARPGDSIDFTVSVHVSDTDGSSVTTSLTVTVSVSDRSDGLPPICKIKPWLAECQPPS